MTRNVQTVLDAYIEAALWSSNDESDEQGGEPLDQNYGPEDLHCETLAAMRSDVEAFLAVLAHGGIEAVEVSDEMMGHDLWLTRNGHGCGFWDRDLGDLGELLSELAKLMGEVNLYVSGGIVLH